MKKLIASSLIAFLVGTAAINTGNAQPTVLLSAAQAAPFQTNVYVQEGTRVNVQIQKAANAKLRIRILNAENNTLATKQVAKNETEGLIRFNLTSLEDGTYRVEISDGIRKQVKEIQLKTDLPSAAIRTVSLA